MFQKKMLAVSCCHAIDFTLWLNLLRTCLDRLSLSLLRFGGLSGTVTCTSQLCPQAVHILLQAERQVQPSLHGSGRREGILCGISMPGGVCAALWLSQFARTLSLRCNPLICFAADAGCLGNCSLERRRCCTQMLHLQMWIHCMRCCEAASRGKL